MPARLPTAVYSALLDAIDEGRLESPAVARAVDTGDASALLFQAIEWARRGALSRARRDARAALAQAGNSATARMAAATVLYVTRDYDEALKTLLEAATMQPRCAGAAYRMAITRAARLGWAHDVRHILSEATALEPDNLRWHVEALRTHVQARSYRRALDHARHATAAEPSAAAIWMERASIAAELNLNEEARDAVKRALEHGGDGGIYAREAARVMCNIGRVAEARHILSRAHQREPEDAHLAADLAEIQLWHDEWDRAAELASHAVDWAPHCAAAHRVLGGVATRRGDLERADEHLDHATDLDPGEYRAWVWKAEGHLARCRWDEVGQCLTEASMNADGFLVVAWIGRMRLAVTRGDRSRIEPYRFGEIREALRELVPGSEAVMESGDPDSVRNVIEQAWAALGGNRSTMPTTLCGDGVRRLRTATGVRHASRKALELIRAESPEAALQEMDAVVARFPDHALPECHRGELLLWLGRLGEAREALERTVAIHRATRWAYIGMTALDILEGAYERALETSARGVHIMGSTEGPAVLVHRGEALRRLGRARESLADLRGACDLHPSRASAWINLALALIDLSETEEAQAIFGRLEDQAPGLLSDAAREAGISLWESRGELPPPEKIRTVLTRALEMMGGNRSSTCITYFTRRGELRYVPHYPHGGKGPHATDGDDLMRARTMLMRATGISDGPPPVSPRASIRRTEPATLDDREVARFLADGFLVVRGAFSKGAAAQWRDHAVRRIREEPERWVKGYDPQDPERDLSQFDPNAPATWTWPRIDLSGERTVRVADFAPRAWGAICDLLGGADRIATTSWTDYLILNLRQEAHLGAIPPAKDWDSWHIDDPSETMRLDSITNGLVVVALFDDVLPGSGATYVAPDSVREVARLLHGADAGVDFVSRRTSASIMGACNRLVELTGQAGDVFLLHPLLMHSSSPNPSGRIRWMGNPMIYMRDPLRFGRAQTGDESPVELAVVRALSPERSAPLHT